MMKTAKKVPKPQAYKIEKDEINDEINEEEQVIEAFKSFDFDGDGTISVREFVSMLNNYSSNLSKLDIEDIIKESNLNMKGTMNYRDFVTFWKKLGN